MSHEIRELTIGQFGGGQYVANVKTKTADFEVRGRYAYDHTADTFTIEGGYDYDDPSLEREVARLDRLPNDPLYSLIESELARSAQ